MKTASPRHPVNLTVYVNAETGSRSDIGSEATISRGDREERALDDPVSRRSGGGVEARHRTSVL
jgi:hypothetical protein